LENSSKTNTKQYYSMNINLFKSISLEGICFEYVNLSICSDRYQLFSACSFLLLFRCWIHL